MAALLGAFEAQKNLVLPPSAERLHVRSFENLDVPPTLVSFAVTTGKTDEVVSPEFKKAGHIVCLLLTKLDENGLPETTSLLENFRLVHEAMGSGRGGPPIPPAWAA